MTKQEAIRYVRSCGENDGPDSYAEVCEIFAALYGREPDDFDGPSEGEIWDHCCAAVDDSAPAHDHSSGSGNCPACLDREYYAEKDEGL